MEIHDLHFEIDPTIEKKWDEQVVAWDNANIFHTGNWASVLKDSYGYKCVYAMSNNGQRLMVPMMEVHSPFTGCRAISMPFSDYCHPLFNTHEDFYEYFRQVIHIGKTHGWKYVEWRAESDLFPQEKAFSLYYCHELDIKKSPEDLLKSFRKGTKSAIKKAERDGLLEIKIANSLDAVKDYYILHCKTRKRLGVPPQPFDFFKKIFEFIISKNRGMVASVLFQDKIVASGVFLHFGKRAIYKFGALDTSYMKLRPTNLLLWRVINYYIDKNFEFFNFGRTNMNNKGLLSFKRGWGTAESLLKYYRYDLKNDKFIQKVPSKKNMQPEVIFKRLPIPLLKLIGKMLYRHVA